MNGGHNVKLTLRQTGLAILFFLGCLATAVFLTINSIWLFDINISLLHLRTATGLTASQMHTDYVQIINYLQNPWKTALKFLYFTSSPNGLQHFKDVRHLVMINNSVGIILLPICGYALVSLNKKSLTWLLITPIKLMVVASLVIISLMIVNFNQVFIYFHELLFRNQDWIFDPNFDPVINMLPDTFFLECFMLFFVFFFGLLGLIYWLGKRSLRIFHNNPQD